MRLQADLVTIPAHAANDGYAPEQIPVDEKTAANPETIDHIRAHLLRMHKRERLLSSKAVA